LRKIFDFFSNSFGGYTPGNCITLTSITLMKEQLESNILTKYAAGLMEAEELRKLEDWLKQNPQFRTTLALIQQNVRAMTMQSQFATK